jgi:hypothetical protein
LLNEKSLTASIIEIYLKWHDIRALQTENLNGMVFMGGPAPIPYLHLGDANCDGSVNLSDAVTIQNFWNGGPPPAICYLNLPDE